MIQRTHRAAIQSGIMEEVKTHPRLLFDLRTRQQAFGPGEVIEIADGSEEFWIWYASIIRLERPFRMVRCAEAPPYPAANGKRALWFSGGVESTYTLAHIRHLDPTLLHVEDFELFQSEHRKIGQIHFLCAAVASSLGYSQTYLGVERNDLLLCDDSFSRGYVERSNEFLQAWSRYQPEHSLLSVCNHLHKEEIIAWLQQKGLQITGTCDRYRGGRWCGDCYKCFEAFYTAKAVNIDLGIRLTRRAFTQYHGEYRRYIDSEFRDNFNNAYQHYVRLQIMRHLKFEPDTDCCDC